MKICKKHGELKEEHICYVKVRGKQYKRCRLCVREQNKKFSSTDKAKAKKRQIRNSKEYKERYKIRFEKYKIRRNILTKLRYERNKKDPEYVKKINQKAKDRYRLNSVIINDAYIKSYLKKYFKIKDNITQEMIEQKREQIIEFRRLRSELKLRRKLLEEIEKERSLRGIVKICKYHGELTRDEVYYTSNGPNNSAKSYKCIICNSGQREMRKLIKETRSSAKYISKEIIELKLSLFKLKKIIKDEIKIRESI